MNNAILRKLRYQQSLRLSFAEDGMIRLRVRRVHLHVSQLGDCDCVTFVIFEKSSGKAVGEIALRIGEDKSLFYLGHIGYHIDLPYRGRRYAMHACALCIPLLRELGQCSAVITTDEDNLPSIRTCEGLHCLLECTVDVPQWCQEEFRISQRKRRYILLTA